MNFKRDILLIDEETTGLDPERHEIIQLAAVLLDRRTLEEKAAFSSYISPRHWDRRQAEAMAVNRITKGRLKGAPSLVSAIREFDRRFDPQTLVLASYVSFNDMAFLKSAYRSCRLPWRFDHHVFDLWGLFYAYRAKGNRLKPSGRYFAGFGLESLKKEFAIRSGKLHDALTDCRVEAEVLRGVLGRLKP